MVDTAKNEILEEAVLAEVDKRGLSPEEVVVVNMLSADFEAPPDMDP